MMRSITSAGITSTWKSPSGSVMSRLKSRASIVGISLGKPDTYDADEEGDEEESEAGDLPSASNNGMRVWYRYVSVEGIADAVPTRQ